VTEAAIARLRWTLRLPASSAGCLAADRALYRPLVFVGTA
jgi:hypothetical protein